MKRQIADQRQIEDRRAIEAEQMRVKRVQHKQVIMKALLGKRGIGIGTPILANGKARDGRRGMVGVPHRKL